MVQETSSRGWPRRFGGLFFASLSILAAKEMWVGEAASQVSKPLEDIFNSRFFPDTKYALRDRYTGTPLDMVLSYLVAVFLPGTAGWDKGSQIQQIYFLISFFSIIGTWSVEAGRRRNTWALIRWCVSTSCFLLSSLTVLFLSEGLC